MARHERKDLIVCLLVAAALALVFFLVGVHREGLVASEARVYESVCRELLAKTTEGRQALVGSIWWPPLAVLLRLPIAAVLKPGTCPVSSLIVSALFGAGSLLLIERIMSRWGLGRTRFLALLPLLANPLFLKEACSGSSGTTAFFVTALTAYSFVEWVSDRKLRHLVYLGGASAFVVALSFDMSLWLVIVLAVLVIDVIRFPSSFRQKEAVLIIALLPVAYTITLWMLLNWLLMGDLLYFVRSLFSYGYRRQLFESEQAAIAVCHYLAAGVSALIGLVSAFRKDRGGVWLGVLAISPLALAWFLAARGFLWSPVPILFCQFPMFVLAVGYMLGRIEKSGSRKLLKTTAWVLILVALYTAISTPLGRHERDDVNRQWQRNAVKRHVLNRSRYAKVFVAGYEAFMFLGDSHDPVFTPALDFNLNRVKTDYEGHRLFLLVHRPVGRSAMDSIHWRYDGIFALGSRGMLYDGTWGDWRLFEIVEAPGVYEP